MAKLTFIFGDLLVILGLWGYFGAEADNRSLTALIPTFFGVAMTVCAVMALNERMLKHAMHAAATIGLVGALAAGGRGLMKVGQLGQEGGRPVFFQLAMAAICAVFVAMCVRSFINTRKAREANAENS